MRRVVVILLAVLAAGCAIHKVETSKSIYEKAVQAEESGKDLEAVAYWKALEEQADREIAANHYLSTNYFLRATARVELGLWDEGFGDLKQIDAGSLREEEYWIYPLYLILQGDYYAANNMTSVASNFYQSVLKKSSYKTSSVYLLALERDVNNSIKAVQLKAANDPDPEKYKHKEYESLAKDVQKYLEEYPFSGVPHYLLADLQVKTGASAEALEHVMAALEMGLPSRDLQKSAEFLLVTIVSGPGIDGPLKTTLLRRAVRWWGGNATASMLRAGENDSAWLHQQDPSFPEKAAEGTLRWMAVTREGKLKILLWEAVGANEASRNMRQ